jgi:hypothetical protein
MPLFLVGFLGSLSRPLLLLDLSLENEHLLGLGGEGREHLCQLGGSRWCRFVDG